MKKIWYVYILECSDGTFYTGITNDLDKRIVAHNAGKGAKYTKGRGPVKLMFVCLKMSKSDAAKYEAKIKKWSRAEKAEHIKYWSMERTSLQFVIEVLKEEGWSTEGEVDLSNPGNNSSYMIWHKNEATIYLGNYYLQGETIPVFPWADPGVEIKHIRALLKGDNKKAFDY